MRPPEPIRTLIGRFDPEVFDAPGGRARIRLALPGDQGWDVVVDHGQAELEGPARAAEPDAVITAAASVWDEVASDMAGGMEAYRRGRLAVRRNLHLAVALLAATSRARGPGRLRFHTVRTARERFSVLEAGTGEPVVMLHGLGATKASFLPLVAGLAPRFRTIAVDLPGFGDSGKPLGAAYDAPFFARSIASLLDGLGIDRAHVIGHSMGGRVALELGFRHPHRTAGLVLMTPSLAWRRPRRWAPYLRLVRPELGLLQAAPRAAVERVVRRLVPGAESPWVAAAIDEFLRSYCTPRGRAAFYAAARQIYLEDGSGPNGFWARLRALAPESLFVWGHGDQLVPIAFARHVREHLPAARHLELPCGHVPQIERPSALNGAILDFLERPPAALAEAV